jgi:hypothetical protein
LVLQICGTLHSDPFLKKRLSESKDESMEIVSVLLAFVLGIIVAIAVGYVHSIFSVKKPTICNIFMKMLDEKFLTDFIQSLACGKEIHPRVLCLQCRPDVAHAAGLRISPMDECVRFVLRDEYAALWKRLFADYKAGAKEAIVIGTSGIGKSMFRFYILREWLLNKFDLGCEYVILNLDETFFLIDRNGNAQLVCCETMPRVGVFALLDPCRLLNGQHSLRFSFLMVATSPSSFVGQSRVCSLTQLTKNATIFPMKAWLSVEVRKGMPNVDLKRLEMFSYKDMAGVEYSVPRWLLYSGREVEVRLADSLTVEARKGLGTWFESNRLEKCNDERLPYRLCAIGEENGRWIAVGFISKYVGFRALKWALAEASVDSRTLLNLLHNPWSRGLVGNVFEQWAFEGISHGRVLEVDPKIRMSNSHLVSEPVTQKITFKSGISYFQWKKERGRYSVEDTQLENHKLYKAAISNLGSIEGYGRVDNKLFLIQTTVSPDDPPAQWDHVASIVSRAAKDLKKNLLQIFLVYLVPKEITFSIPTCPTFNGMNGFICTGMVENDDFESKFFDPKLLDETFLRS